MVSHVHSRTQLVCMNPITKDILIWFDNMNGANTTKNDYS